MIRHVSEAHNHEFYPHFLLFSTTTKVLTIVQMPKVIKANSKAIRNSVEKAKNIQLAVQAYKNPSSGLSLRAAALLYGCNKDSITNHLNNTPETSQIRYAPDVYVERQLLNTAKETALCNHILECYQSHLSLNVELFHHYANELLQARLGPLREEDKVKTNWHIRFYQRHPSIKGLRARPFEKERLVNEDPDDYIKWFQKFKKTVDKWNILLEDTYNMDESEAGLGATQKSYIIGPAEEKDARVSTDKNRK
jgi:hypothetical protein